MAFDVTKKEKFRSLAFIERDLADLHIHVGASVSPHIMWSIAHQQGLRLPTRNYWEFLELVTVSPKRVSSIDDYLSILHKWTEKIQSSPHAMERSVYEIISKEYRGSNVTRIEIRFNPMKRNLGGERDLDHIIHASLRGLDQACLEYSCEAALIFCLARESTFEQNSIIVDKAIKYRDRGVVGIDIAGPEQGPLEKDAVLLERYAALFARARNAGLKITLHTGETPHTGPEGVIAAVKRLRPDRIGHGIQAALSDEALRLLREEGTVLEVCPSSNLWCKTVDGIEGLRTTFRRLVAERVRFTVNTDGTYLLKTNLLNEFKLLHENRILDEGEIQGAIETAWNASFLASSS
jgi:adenosine deaminase